MVHVLIVDLEDLVLVEVRNMEIQWIILNILIFIEKSMLMVQNHIQVSLVSLEG